MSIITRAKRDESGVQRSPSVELDSTVGCVGRIMEVLDGVLKDSSAWTSNASKNQNHAM